MKCPNCEAEMETRRENHLYAECGLPYVTLQDIQVRHCNKCGEHLVSIPRVESLHRQIVRDVVRKRARLTADEIRFLRKSLGYSGADLARHMKTTPATVSRWENGSQRMNIYAEMYLRAVAVTEKPIEEYEIDRMNEDESPRPVRLGLRLSDKGWEEQVVEP